ncbi:hypothetical protein [Kribbella sp. C-35]
MSSLSAAAVQQLFPPTTIEVTWILPAPARSPQTLVEATTLIEAAGA